MIFKLHHFVVLFPVVLSFTRTVVCVYDKSPQKNICKKEKLQKKLQKREIAQKYHQYNNCKKEKLQSGKKESLPRGVTKEPLQKREIAKGRLNLLRV